MSYEILIAEQPHSKQIKNLERIYKGVIANHGGDYKKLIVTSRDDVDACLRDSIYPYSLRTHTNQEEKFYKLVEQMLPDVGLTTWLIKGLTDWEFACFKIESDNQAGLLMLKMTLNEDGSL